MGSVFFFFSRRGDIVGVSGRLAIITNCYVEMYVGKVV